MKLFTKLILVSFFLTSQLFAQNSALYIPLSMSDYPQYSDDLPEFVRMTFQPNVNFQAVVTAFEIYEKAEKTKKNRITEGVEVEDKFEVFFHRWKRAYEPFAQVDGTIVLPNRAEFKQQLQEQNRANQGQLNLRSGAANWTNVGPRETHWLKDDNTAQPPCPWQVNIYAFDISKSNTSILYACPETGGIWKTTDKGLNWTECRPDLKFGGTGNAVEIHPTNPNIVYVGINSFLWKTTDGGATWVDLTNCTASGPNDIAISPADPNIVMVAADNGFFRSTDGGSTWTCLYTQACYDIEINPNDATHVFILRVSSGSTVDFYKSTDSGASFTLKTTGISALRAGRLTVSAADGNRIYALCTSSSNPPKLLKSTNEGETWTNMNPTFCTGGVSDAEGGQGYYDLSIAASQTNANELIYGFCTTAKAVSTDGGSTFTFSNLGGYCGNFPLHPDLQEAKSVMNNGVMETWVSTDGGFTFSTDFFSSTNNASSRNNGIYSTDFWGFAQGWNEDILVGGRYHNGNTAISENYPTGKALRMGGAEQGTGYVLHGSSQKVTFSDLGDGWVLPNTFYENSQGRFKYTKHPNEDGYGFNSTPLIIHPNYFNHQFLGEGNTLWKTTDNGLTFVALRDFGSRVRRFDVSRSNPSVMYVATETSFNKTTDGGVTWSAITLPTNRSSATLYLAINPANEDDVWICFSNIDAAGRVYQTTDGGNSWTAKDGTGLSGLKIRSIIHTGGGIYIAPDNGNGRVFYRATSATDWTDFSTNLPASTDILRIIPFYRDGKLRVGGNRGAWETPLAEAIVPIVMPSVNKKVSNCIRDTFYFEDYSIVKHAGTTWLWEFSSATNPNFTPQYVSSLTARNPKVVFGQTGDFTVKLTITNSLGTSTKTITNMVTVNSFCSPDVLPLQTLRTAANEDYFIAPEAKLTNLTHFTVTGWWKPNGAQQPYAALFSSGDWCAHCDYTEGLIFDYNGSKLWYKWPGNSAVWGSNSGIDIPLNEWSYVALVITPTGATLYLNEKKMVDNRPLSPGDIANIYIGYGHYSQSFKGDIDEVTMWRRALSDDEIRRLRHLTKENIISTDPDLIGYWQFNELVSGVVMDKAKVLHGTLTGGAILANSTAPIGSGVSARLTVNSGGIKDFSNANCQMEFPLSGIFPNGDIVVTKINTTPNQNPTGGTPLSNYWIINNYGTNNIFTPLLNLKFNNLSSLSNPATNYKLYRRNANAEGATWGTTLDGGDNLASNTLTFTPALPCVGITSFGQFGITDDPSATPPAPPCIAQSTATHAASLTGVSTSNIQSAISAPNFGTSQNFTISFWFKSESTASDAVIVSDKSWSSGRNKGWVFALQNGILKLNIGDGSNRIDITSQTALNDNQWHHVAASVTRTGQPYCILTA